MNKVALQNIAMVVAPIIGISVAAGGTVYQFRRLQRYQDDLAAKRKKVNILETSLREMQMKNVMPRIPIALQSPREQPEFLDAVRSYAEPLRVQLARWSNATNKPALVQNTSANSANGENKEAPKEYQAIANTLEVKGKYTAVRAFLYQLLRAPRLYTLNDVKWSRDSKGGLTTTSFTLTRYVTSPSSSIAQVMQAHAKAANNPQNSDPSAPSEKRGIFTTPSASVKREFDETTQPKPDHYHDQPNH